MDCSDEESESFDVINNWENVKRFLRIYVPNCLQQLDRTYETIGYSEEEKKEKRQIIIEQVKDIFKDLLDEGNCEKNSFLNEIVVMLEELGDLSMTLRLNINDVVRGYEDLPLRVANENLKNKIREYSQLCNNNNVEMNNLIAQQDAVCKILGKTPKIKLNSSLPDKESIKKLKAHVNNLLEEKNKRENIFQKLHVKIQGKVNDLNYEPNPGFEQNICEHDISNFLLTDENMALIQNFYDLLMLLDSKYKKKTTESKEKILKYWKILNESPDMTIFNKKNTYETYLTLKEEEERCKNEILLNIDFYIDQMKQEIHKLWAQCSFSDEEKHYPCFNPNSTSDDLLNYYEAYVDELVKFLSDNKEIYDLILRRRKLLNRRGELDNEAMNPNRFKNRGAQLLQEEKERNSLKTTLSKVEQKLLHLVEQYKNKYGKPFTIDGETIPNVIQNDLQRDKEKQKLILNTKMQNRDIKLSLYKTKKLFKIPIIRVNGSMIRRASLERRKKFETKRRPKTHRSSTTISSNSSDYTYEDHEKGIKTANSLSTLKNERLSVNNKTMTDFDIDQLRVTKLYGQKPNYE